MSGQDDKPDESFLGRWSRKKQESRQPPGTPGENPSTGAVSRPEMPETPRPSTTLPAAPPAELPPVESLTRDSDFTPFMGQGVKAETRNAALKTLFTDPHFNQMDGLDVYIDDYTTSTPIPMEMLRTLQQAKSLFAQEPANALPVTGAEPAGALAETAPEPEALVPAEPASTASSPPAVPAPSGKDAT